MCRAFNCRLIFGSPHRLAVSRWNCPGRLVNARRALRHGTKLCSAEPRCPHAASVTRCASTPRLRLVAPRMSTRACAADRLALAIRRGHADRSGVAFGLLGLASPLRLPGSLVQSKPLDMQRGRGRANRSGASLGLPGPASPLQLPGRGPGLAPWACQGGSTPTPSPPSA